MGVLEPLEIRDDSMVKNAMMTENESSTSCSDPDSKAENISVTEIGTSSSIHWRGFMLWYLQSIVSFLPSQQAPHHARHRRRQAGGRYGILYSEVE